MELTEHSRLALSFGAGNINDSVFRNRWMIRATHGKQACVHGECCGSKMVSLEGQNIR